MKGKKPQVELVKMDMPRSLAIFEKGIGTGHDFAKGMSALMSDLISGCISPSVGNAVSNAGGKLLKVVEMQHKYGVKGAGPDRTLNLALDPGESAE